MTQLIAAFVLVACLLAVGWHANNLWQAWLRYRAALRRWREASGR